MTTLTLTPAATFRALHRQQGDVTLAIAVAGAMRARHRMQGDVTLSLLVNGAMRHSYVDDAIEGDYYRYFGGAPSFGSSVYDDTWDGGPPNIWGGVSFSYAENTPIFSFGNLFFAAGQGENEMIAERTRLVGEGLECEEVSWAAEDWEITDDVEGEGFILDGDSLILNPATLFGSVAGGAVYQGTSILEGDDVTYKVLLTYRDDYFFALSKESGLFLKTAGIASITAGGWVSPAGGIAIRHSETGTDSNRRVLYVESYTALGVVVNSYQSPQITPGSMVPGVEVVFELKARLHEGLLDVWLDDELLLENWDPGAYDSLGEKLGTFIHADTSAFDSYMKVSGLQSCVDSQNIVTALEMYPIRTVLERIGLPVMRFDRQGQGKVEPNKIKFIRGVYPIIDAPPGTRLLISIGSQDKVNDATAWEGPFPFVVGEDYFVDFVNSGRYVSIRYESLGQPPWQLLGYDLDVEILGER